MMKEHLIQKHQDLFNVSPQIKSRVFFAPGRVNLIGEHTDYNGGHVFPCALTLGTYVVCSPNDTKTFRFFSMNYSGEGIKTFEPHRFTFNPQNGWCNYALAVLAQFEKEGVTFQTGMDVFVHGNLPNGAGLSSSASLELAVSEMINALYDLKRSKLELIKLCQRAENEFIGVQCGIMDQFAIGMGRENHAILLNTQSLSYQYAPLDLEGYQIVIANTNRRRGLSESKYNERRSECEQALLEIQHEEAIDSLCDLSPERFEQVSKHLSNPILFKRARHAVFENQRTLEAYQLLSKGDLKGFGGLMADSHASLRDDYEVSCDELDILVDLAQNFEGVIGARMTGAGFGGCTVNLVKSECVNAFVDEVGQAYLEKVGYAASFYKGTAGEGSRELLEDIERGRK